MKKKVISTLVSTGKFQKIVENIFELAEQQASSYVCFANVHMIMESHKDKSFNKLLNEADIVSPDGRPVSVYMRVFDGVKQDRVPGMDVVPAIMEKANLEGGKSVYFYGSTEDVLEKIAHKIKTDYPNVRLAGTYSPPFRKLTEEEDQEIIQMINDANPDFVFVSLGCPKQEKWMADHKDKVNACMLGVGQAFLTFIGTEKRLPKWARNLSLEWTYRLWLEPKRLWKRYLFTNSRFLFLVAQYWVRRKVLGIKS